MLRHPSLKLIACCLALSACVTINVYFPAAAAEKAADKIINDIVGGAVPAESTKRDDENKQGAVREDSRPDRVLLAAAASVLDFIVPPAQAQANLNVDTPEIRALTRAMEARFAQMKKYFDSGSIGVARDGLVQVRDQNLVPLPERNVVRKLIAEDNADRANLYKEMAAANGHPEWVADIRTTFAQRWAARAQSSGWYYQDANGAWTKK